MILEDILFCGDPGNAPLAPPPPPVLRQAAKLPRSDLRFLCVYGAMRISRQGIQRAILMDPPRRFDEQWNTRTL